MSFNTVPTVSNGDSWSAAQHNTYIKDNFAAVWVGTTAGDTDYYTSATAKARRAIGTDYQVSRINGGVPTWADHPAFTSVYKSANQSFSSGSGDVISFNQELVDSGNWHSNVTNNSRITVAQTGYYLPHVAIRWVKDSGGSGTFNMETYVRKNGTAETANRWQHDNMNISATPKEIMYGGIPISLSASDYLEVYFVQSSGGAGNVTGGGANETSFALYRLR